MSFAGVAHSSVTCSSSRALVPSVAGDCHACEQGWGEAPRKNLCMVCKALASFFSSRKEKGLEGKGSRPKAGVSRGPWAMPIGTQAGFLNF